MTSRLPVPGQDDGVWGTILNDYLSVEHNSDGSLKRASDIDTAKSTAQAAQQTATNAQTAANTAKTTADAAYTKPSTGIPKSDLMPAVQSSLDKADSALQSAPVASVVGQTGAVTGAQIAADAAFAGTFARQLGHDVRDYGAVGDGATDDSDAIQAAINAAAATDGGTVYLAAKVFALKKPLLVKNKVILKGVSRSGSKLRAVAGFSGAYVVRIGDGSAIVAGAVLRDLTVDANNIVAGCVYTTEAQELSGCESVVLTKFTSIGFESSAGAGPPRYFHIQDAEIYGSSTGWSYGIKLSSSTGPISIDRVTINSNTAGVDGIAGLWVTSSRVRVSHFHGEKVADSILMDAGASGSIDGVDATTEVSGSAVHITLANGGGIVINDATSINDEKSGQTLGYTALYVLGNEGSVKPVLTETNIATKSYVGAPLVADTIALIGTSITARNNYAGVLQSVPGGAGLTTTTSFDTGGSTYLWDALGYWNWANILLGQRFVLLANKGVGGNTTTQMLARFSTDILTLSPRPAWLLIEPGPNDAGALISAQTSIANIRSMISQAVSSGMRVVLCTMTPNSVWTAGSAPRQAQSSVNAWILHQARSEFPGIVVCDWTAPVIDVTNGGPSTSLFINESGTYVHPTPNGAGMMGQALASALAPHFPALDRLPWDPGDPYNLLSNPFNAGGTTTATGLSVDRDDGGGAISGAASKVLRTDNIPGWWQQATISANNVRIRQDNTSAGTDWQAGTDWVFGLAEFQTDTDWTTPKAFSAYISFMDAGANELARSRGISYRTNDGDVFFRPPSGVFFVPPQQIPANTTRMRFCLSFLLSGNVGAGTIRLGRRMIRKVGV